MSDQQQSGHRPPTGVQRDVATVLMRRGHYEETADAPEWIYYDSLRVVELVDERGLTQRNVWDAIVDTGLHDPENDDEVACLAADVEALKEVLCGA